LAWLEFPASWISFGMGLRLAVVSLQYRSYAVTKQIFSNILPLYFKYVFTLLVIAAIIESLLIVIAERNKDKFQ